MPKHRMSRGLVALSATAVASVYTAGYVQTQAADASLASTPTPVSVSPARPSAQLRVQPIPRTSTTPTPATVASTQPTASWRDGTYTGVGTSRRGTSRLL